VLAAGDPVIAVATKQKERVGDCKQGGRAGPPTGQAEEGRVHACPLPERGRVRPSDVDDLAAHAGGVSGGLDHAPAAVAVATRRRGWARSGRARDPPARRLLITAAGGGSTGARVRLWKGELHQLAAATGLAITVCHFPPGTSTWNPIAPRLCSFSSQNGRGKPLVSDAVILSRMAATTTTTTTTTTTAGLPVESARDTPRSPTGVTIADADLAPIQLERGVFHGEWNDTIRPHAA
jgi:Rhodopirellula transposase DDE domain